MAEEDYLYVVKKPCPICGLETRATKVRSRLITETVDSDLCTHYKDINPYYYRIWLCEHCGYAEDERHFLNGVSPKEKRAIQDFLAERNSASEFSEKRTRDDAIKAFKLAIFFSKFTKETLAHKAGLNLSLAWLYREAGDKENEDKFLAEAGKLYIESRSREDFPQGPMTEADCIYLIGAIHCRLADYDTAGKYLSMLMHNKELETKERVTVDRAKDLWADMREKMKEERADAAAEEAQPE